MTDRLISILFFLIVTSSVNSRGVLGANSTTTSSRGRSGEERALECEECIRRVRTYFSITVKDPTQFCIDNEICPNSEAPSSEPTSAPTINFSDSPSLAPTRIRSSSPSTEPTISPSVLPTSPSPSYLPTLIPSDLPSDGPSILASDYPTGVPTAVVSTEPSEISSETHSLSHSPSNLPSIIRSEHPSAILSSIPSGDPSKMTSVIPTLSTEPSTSDSTILDTSNILKIDEKQNDSSTVPDYVGILLPSVSPSLRPFSAMPSPQSLLPESFPRSPPTIRFQSHFTADDSMNKELESISSASVSWRTTLSSLFLRNIRDSMDFETTKVFSAIALQFLNDHSPSNGYNEKVIFLEVRVVGQGPEFGNSTKVNVHVVGMHIYFETIVDVGNNFDFDLPELIETIFKTYKDEFYLKLAESNEFFTIFDQGSPITKEDLIENRFVSSGNFMNTWVISSLAVVICSVFVTAILVLRMARRNPKRRGLLKDTFESDIYPLYTVEQSSSDESSERMQTQNKRRKTEHMTHVHDCDDSLELFLNADEESLAGLKLLSGDDRQSCSYSPSGMEQSRKQNSDGKILKIDTCLDELDNIVEEEMSKQPGYYARMRKRSIERDVQKRRSPEGTSMETILIATMSIKGEENAQTDQGIKRDKIEGVSGIEVAAGNFETPSEKSITKRISNFIRRKSIRRRPMEPVEIIEEGDSMISYPSTAGHSLDNQVIRYENELPSERNALGSSLSINTNIFERNEGREADILSVDRYDVPKAEASLFSPLTVDTSITRKERPEKIKTTFISSPVSKRLQNTKEKRKETRTKQTPDSSLRTRGYHFY